jgi:hypothetical protein
MAGGGLREVARWQVLRRAYLLARWFLLYPPLFVVSAGLLAIIAFDVGTSFGAPDMVWHERLGTQVAGAVFLVLLFAELGLVGYLLEADEPWLADAPSPPRRLALWYANTPCLLLLAGLALGATHGEQAPRWPAVVAALATFALLNLVGARVAPWLLARPRIARIAAQLDKFARVRKRRLVLVASRTRELHAVQMFLAALLLVGYVVVHLVRDRLPALVVVCVFVALVFALWGFLAFYFERSRLALGFVAALLAVALVPTLRDRKIAGLPEVDLPASAAEFATRSPASPPLLDDCRVLANWTRRFTPDAKPPLVLVAASGGGVRAATWAAAVLARLERDLADFPAHVRLITGASGGMLGAGAWVAGLVPSAGRPRPPDTASPLPSNIAHDSLTPLLRELLVVTGDRGRALETAWEQATGGDIAHPFSWLRPGEDAGWLPSMVYAPMLVEDGRQLLISNLELGSLTRNRGPLLSGLAGSDNQVLSVTGLQMFRLFPDGAARLKISTAARLNATFPYITNAVELPTRPLRRAVDAGYYDDYGGSLAGRWLYQHAGWLLHNTSGVLLIQIRDRKGEVARKSIRDVREHGRNVLSPLSAPIEGILQSWASSMAFRDDDLIEVVAKRFSERGGANGFFATAAIEFVDQAPLSWTLSSDERARLLKILDRPDEDTNRPTLAAVAQWWRERPSQLDPAALVLATDAPTPTCRD